jgi:hypothetical protein
MLNGWLPPFCSIGETAAADTETSTEKKQEQMTRKRTFAVALANCPSGPAGAVPNERLFA